MFYLLRKIRMALLGNRNISKYLLYAVGEVFLVVIGISIAVSIDEARKQKDARELEKEILVEIASNLQEDIELLNDTTFIQSIIRANRFVVDHLDGKSVNQDSIGFYYAKIFGGFIITLNNSGYNSLESIGMNLIEDQELRQKITKYYTGTFNVLLDASNRDNRFTSDIITPLIIEHIRSEDAFYDLAYPVNYKELQKNNQFREALLLHITAKRFYMFRMKEASEEINALRKDILVRIADL